MAISLFLLLISLSFDLTPCPPPPPKKKKKKEENFMDYNDV
jgi:hypothetical protein